MSVLALKFTDFNSEDGVSVPVMIQPPSFAPLQEDEVCEVCQTAEEKRAALEAQFAQNLAAQSENMQVTFEGQLKALQQDMETQLRIGLKQILTALFPALAENSLRMALATEIQKSLIDTLPETLSVKISPEISDLIDVPPGVNLVEDADLKGHVAEIIQGAARTRLDPEAILNSCLHLLKSEPAREI